MSVVRSFAVLLVATATAAAQPPKLDRSLPDVIPVDFECRWAHGPIKIDGKVDEAVWKDAEQIDLFYQPWRQEDAQRGRTATKARLLWDREHIYFLAELEDTDLYADVREHDGQTWDNDVFELFFKPAVDKPGYYEFQVNAANTRMDMFLPRRNAGGFKRFASTFPFEFDSAVVRQGTLNRWQDQDQGWTVEGSISWKSFVQTGGRPAVDERWKFALCRYDFSVDFEGPDLTSCAPLKSKRHPDFHRHEDYATLKFIGPRDTRSASARFRPEPLTTSRVVGSPDPPKPYRVVKEYPNLKLDFPICMRRIPDSDQLLVINASRSYAPARLLRMTDSPGTSEFTSLMNFPGVAYDITFHPRFRENGFVYVGSHEPKHADGPHCVIMRYTMMPAAPYTLDTESAVRIIEWSSNGHNGAAVVFGKDGMLYVTTGDGTVRRDTDEVGQRLDTLRSKVLRLNVDKTADGKTYSIPPDNPFVGFPGARPETWSYGLRNPWRIAADKRTGRIWVGNNGQDTWEQVYLIERGANYGWSVYEGRNLFIADRAVGPTPVTRPTFDHHHAEARSLTGGIVYYGDKLPELHGAYLYGDYSTGKIWAAKHDGQRVVWHEEIADTSLHITCFATDKDGELLIADHRGDGLGGFYRLQLQSQPKAVSKSPSGSPRETHSDSQSPSNDPAAFPRRLSETGLFRSTAEHQVQAGVIPYSVNVPGWHDGATAERFLALPAEQQADGRWETAPIEFTTRRGWRFPEGAVLLQTLSIERQPGDPRSSRRLETRLLTKQQGEFAAYSYLWNDSQTDAELVSETGTDLPLTVTRDGRPQRFTWHVPSRTACMSCHSRAFNYVLGLNELQMNRERNDGDFRGNQLEMLELAGLLQTSNWIGAARDQWRDKLRAEIESASDAGKTSEDEVTAEVTRRLREITATRDQRPAPGTSRLLNGPPHTYRSLPDPFDDAVPLADRARSWLHANCAHCHVTDGGGNAKIVLEWGTADADMNVFDVPAMHGTFGLEEPRLASAGQPSRSVLAYRIASLGGGRMPRLGSRHVDVRGAALIRQWLRSLGNQVTDEPRRTLLAKKFSKRVEAKLVPSTSDALLLLELAEPDDAPDRSRSIIDALSQSDEPAVRALFERFVPEERRVQRLGTHVDAASLLSVPGDAERGRRLFFEVHGLACRNCHQIAGRGKMLGPDLTQIGKKLDRAKLLASILSPSDKVEDKYATWTLVTDSGRVHAGLILKRTESEVHLKTAEGNVLKFASDELDDLVRQPKSLMPDFLMKDLTAAQAADLLAFLASLK